MLGQTLPGLHVEAGGNAPAASARIYGRTLFQIQRATATPSPEATPSQGAPEGGPAAYQLVDQVAASYGGTGLSIFKQLLTLPSQVH